MKKCCINQSIGNLSKHLILVFMLVSCFVLFSCSQPTNSEALAPVKEGVPIKVERIGHVDASSLPVLSNQPSLTVQLKITTSDRIKAVKFEKDGSLSPKELFNSPTATDAVQSPSSNSLWSFDVTENGKYAVVALDEAGRRETEEIIVREIDRTGPNVVRNVSTSYDSTEKTFTLSWEAPTPSGNIYDSPVDHYLISFVTNDGNSDSDFSTPIRLEKDELTYTFTEIDDTKKYYRFNIKAVDKLGNQNTGYSLQHIFNQIVGEDFVFVQGITTNTQIGDSEVFIAGRNLTIKNFYICNHEVTQKEYSDIMGNNPSNNGYDEDAAKCPVESLSWYNAIIYCNKRSIAESLLPCYSINGETNPDNWGASPKWSDLQQDLNSIGYRLPLLAEWEYAARGGSSMSTQQYIVANDEEELLASAWISDNSGSKTHAVCTKAPNSLGLYDMVGNVTEWCWDWNATINTTTPIEGPNTGTDRSTRLANYRYSTKESCSFSTASDLKYTPTTIMSFIGFRVVCSAQ